MFGAKQQVPGPRSSDQESAAKVGDQKMKMSVLEWLHRNPGVHDIAVIARATGFNQKVVDHRRFAWANYTTFHAIAAGTWKLSVPRAAF
jgi:hypothetical protein